MNIISKLRFVLYPLLFLVVFLGASFCTFPKTVLRDLAESTLTYAAMGLKPQSGTVPQVNIDKVSLWRISGVALSGLKISWPQKMGESPVLLELDTFKTRVGVFSMLFGSRAVHVDTGLYDGEIEADIKIRRQNVLGSFNLEASKINFAKMSFFEPFIGAPLEGIFNAVANINANSELQKDGTGSIKFNADALGFGPGSVRLPAGGFVSSLTVPKISLGKLNAELVLDKGQLESKVFQLSGGDLEADLRITISLGRMPSSSRITGDGWFSLKKEFVSTNETLKMLYELIPELKEASFGDGKVGLTIRGNLARPQMRLERYNPANIQKIEDNG